MFGGPLAKLNVSVRIVLRFSSNKTLESPISAGCYWHPEYSSVRLSHRWLPVYPLCVSGELCGAQPCDVMFVPLLRLTLQYSWGVWLYKCHAGVTTLPPDTAPLRKHDIPFRFIMHWFVRIAPAWFQGSILPGLRSCKLDCSLTCLLSYWLAWLAKLQSFNTVRIVICPIFRLDCWSRGKRSVWLAGQCIASKCRYFYLIVLPVTNRDLKHRLPLYLRRYCCSCTVYFRDSILVIYKQ
jgi:hypothetical protein